MNAITPMRSGPQLTDQQQRFVEYLVASGCSGAEAAREAGFAAPAQEAYRLMRKPHVMAAVRDERERVISGTLCNIAVKTLAEIMVDKELPASARVAACRVVVDMGGHFDSARGKANEKPLNEMSNAELEAFLSRAQAVIDDGGDRPLITISN